METELVQLYLFPKALFPLHRPSALIFSLGACAVGLLNNYLKIPAQNLHFDSKTSAGTRRRRK